MIGLKPCPFCGADLKFTEEVWRHPKTNITDKYPVYYHPKRHCILDFHRFHFYVGDEKVKAWNRRVTDENDLQDSASDTSC